MTRKKLKMCIYTPSHGIILLRKRIKAVNKAVLEIRHHMTLGKKQNIFKNATAVCARCECYVLQFVYLQPCSHITRTKMTTKLVWILTPCKHCSPMKYVVESSFLYELLPRMFLKELLGLGPHDPILQKLQDPQ